MTPTLPVAWSLPLLKELSGHGVFIFRRPGDEKALCSFGRTRLDRSAGKWLRTRVSRQSQNPSWRRWLPRCRADSSGDPWALPARLAGAACIASCLGRRASMICAVPCSCCSSAISSVSGPLASTGVTLAPEAAITGTRAENSLSALAAPVLTGAVADPLAHAVRHAGSAGDQQPVGGRRLAGSGQRLQHGLGVSGIINVNNDGVQSVSLRAGLGMEQSC